MCTLIIHTGVRTVIVQREYNIKRLVLARVPHKRLYPLQQNYTKHIVINIITKNYAGNS